MDIPVLVAIVVGLIVLWAALIALFWVFRPRDVSIRELVGVVPDLVRMLRDIVRDPTSPMDVRVVLVGLLLWILSPIDLIPEFIPVVGPLDDVLVAVVALRYVRRRIGVDAMRAQWPGTDDGFGLLGRVVGSDCRTLQLKKATISAVSSENAQRSTALPSRMWKISAVR